METLLTAKQVQDLLHIDRTTIYRMLKDGRLTGVKVGQQWRFSSREVDDLLAGVGKVGVSTNECALPLHCVQTVQNVFAEIAEVGAVTTQPDGQPLTTLSNNCEFCQLIQGSAKGKAACIESWRKLGEAGGRTGEPFTCHAGLQYAGAPIRVRGEAQAYLISGQFYADAPDKRQEAERVRQMALDFEVDENALTAAVERIPVIDSRKKSQLRVWLSQVAHTFEEITTERVSLMNRLNQIAAMSDLNPKQS